MNAPSFRRSTALLTFEGAGDLTVMLPDSLLNNLQTVLLSIGKGVKWQLHLFDIVRGTPETVGLLIGSMVESGVEVSFQEGGFASRIMGKLTPSVPVPDLRSRLSKMLAAYQPPPLWTPQPVRPRPVQGHTREHKQAETPRSAEPAIKKLPDDYVPPHVSREAWAMLPLPQNRSVPKQAPKPKKEKKNGNGQSRIGKGMPILERLRLIKNAMGERKSVSREELREIIKATGLNAESAQALVTNLKRKNRVLETDGKFSIAPGIL